MNCLLEFRKMTFTIHLIFSLLTGIIIRPFFTTFCYMFYYHLFLTKHMVLHFMFLEFLPRKKCFLTSTITMSSSLYSMVCHTLRMLQHKMFLVFTWVKMFLAFCALTLCFIKFLRKKFFLAFYAYTWCLLSFFGCVLRNVVSNSSWIL